MRFVPGPLRIWYDYREQSTDLRTSLRRPWCYLFVDREGTLKNDNEILPSFGDEWYARRRLT